jgi:Tfp pilus assembly PilM family ATPase
MNGTQRSVGFNITTSRLQFVEVEKVSDQINISNLGQSVVSPSINFDQKSEDEILLQLNSAFDELNLGDFASNSTASFTLPPELFITLQLPYESKLNHSEITEEFRWELSQLFPFIQSEDLAIKYYELRKGFLHGENNALVVALNKKYLLLLKNFCAKNNMTPRLVDNASITSNLFINTFFSVHNSTVAHIYNSKGLFTIFINLSSKPAFVKTLSKSEIDLTNLTSNKVVTDTLRLIKEAKPDYSFISGEEMDADLFSELQSATGLSFIQYNPFDAVKFKPELQNHEVPAKLYTSFISATGIAARFN